MTVLIINPGSEIQPSTEAAAWTNTYAGAAAEAQRWLANMHRDVSPDIELLDSADEPVEGRWTFQFKHTVTGKVVELETHGINDVEAYRKDCIFYPRVYWNGSSSSNPELEHFAAPGFVVTFRAEV